MNRRTFLQRSGLPALGLALTPLAKAEHPGRKRLLRVAHLTDIHVQPGLGAADGMRAALRHAQGLADPVDCILFGGDCIGDALESDRARVLEQWAVWDEVLRSELKLPAYQCLGNHDIYGWKLRHQSGVEQDPLFGKPAALARLGLASAYYSFDLRGWHFVVLDSMVAVNDEHGYAGRLDEDQFSWLAGDLARTPAATPICVLSHIPILSAAAFLDGNLATSGIWRVPGAWMHLDAVRLKNLFQQHPNVKVCLSGHLHLVDDVSYLGVRYLCNGAVCGAWWKGPYQEFGPAYATLDLYADGTVTRTMVDYLAK